MNITLQLENLVNIISFIVSIVSFLYAIYCHHLAKKAEKKQRTLNWKDVSIAAKDLAKQIKDDHRPDIIYVPSIKSGIIVHFIRDYFSEYIPVITGQLVSKKQFSIESTNKIQNHDQYLCFETKKWYAYVPKNLLDYKSKNLLIIDDFAMSGDFLQTLSIILSDNGFNPESIQTLCLATTEVAVKSEKSPTYYWKQFSTTDVYMPWGKPM